MQLLENYKYPLADKTLRIKGWVQTTAKTHVERKFAHTATTDSDGRAIIRFTVPDQIMGRNGYPIPTVLEVDIAFDPEPGLKGVATQAHFVVQ